VANRETFFEGLEKKLAPHYGPPQYSAGNDIDHIRRVIQIAESARGINLGNGRILDFDSDELRAAALLHEMDRSRSLGEEIGKRAEKIYRNNSQSQPDPKILRRTGIRDLAKEYLRGGGFQPDQEERIITAVLEHSKKDDDLEHDSGVLTALRIGDKIDRMGPLGLISAAAHRGGSASLYDFRHPFGYGSTEEGRMKTVFDDHFRVFEWYAMLPCDDARELANPRFRMRIFFMRELAKEIAAASGVENRIEEDLKRALGQYYNEFPPTEEVL
jgi:hypothetical protein